MQIREHALRWQGITRCRQSKPDSRIDVVLVGDSHAEHLFVGLAEAAPSKNIAYYVVAETPIRSDDDTNRVIDHVAADPAIATVIVSVNWALRGVPHDGLTATFKAFTAAGKAVYTTDDVPTFPFDVSHADIESPRYCRPRGAAWTGSVSKPNSPRTTQTWQTWRTACRVSGYLTRLDTSAMRPCAA